VTAIMVENSVPPKDIRAFHRDGAFVNRAAMKLLEPFCPNAIDITCLSHGVQLAGNEFQTPIAQEFCSKWSQLMSTSVIARNKFSQRAASPKRKGKVRWFTEWEVMEQLSLFFPAVKEVVNLPGDFGPKLRPAMQEILSTSMTTLIMELAIIVDVGRVLVGFCYVQEGDGFLAPRLYQHAEKVSHTLDMICGTSETNPDALFLPIAYACARNISPDDVLKQTQLLSCAIGKARPVRAKWIHGLETTFKTQMQMFRGCRLLDPAYVSCRSIDTLVAEVPYLVRLPSLTSKSQAITSELPAYKALCDGISEDCDLLVFWKGKKETLPVLFLAAKEAALLQPSSGTVERVFSMLDWMFTSQQDGCLQDGKEASVKMRYNALQRAKNTI